MENITVGWKVFRKLEVELAIIATIATLAHHIQ